jgi:hypothetical protein
LRGDLTEDDGVASPARRAVEDAYRFSALGSGDDGKDFVPAAIEDSILGAWNNAAMNAYGNLAAAAKCGQRGAFCCDGKARVAVVEERQGRNRLLVVFACLNTKRALAGGRAEICGVETLANPFCLFEAIETGGGKQDGVYLSLS